VLIAMRILTLVSLLFALPALAQEPAYPCPTVAEKLVPAAVPADHGLKVGFSAPEGLVWSKHQSPEHGGVLKIARLELPFLHTGDKRYPERLLVLQVEHGPAMPVASLVPQGAAEGAYVMGSGAPEAQSMAGFKAGELVLGGQKIEVRRMPGTESARFVVRLVAGETGFDVTVKVSIARVSPVTVHDMHGEACVALFDRVGLAVAQSLVLK
jgi:hypothetical protein